MMNVLKGAKLMRDLRTYLELLKDRVPDQFVRVSEPVDWKYEITHYVTVTIKGGLFCGCLFPRRHALAVGNNAIAMVH